LNIPPKLKRLNQITLQNNLIMFKNFDFIQLKNIFLKFIHLFFLRVIFKFIYNIFEILVLNKLGSERSSS